MVKFQIAGVHLFTVFLASWQHLRVKSSTPRFSESQSPKISPLCMHGCFLTIYIHHKNSKMIGKKHIITMVANSAQTIIYIYIDVYIYNLVIIEYSLQKKTDIHWVPQTLPESAVLTEEMVGMRLGDELTRHPETPGGCN